MNKGLFFIAMWMLCSVHATTQTIIEYTSFESESPGGLYVATFDPTSDYALLNNPGQATVTSTQASADAGELGFSATYLNTRGSSGLTDGDFVGVTPTNNALSFPDGAQGYQFSDCDGAMLLSFDPVNLRTLMKPYVSLYYFLNTTFYELDDRMRIWVETDMDGNIDLLNTTDQDIDDLDIKGEWTRLFADLSGNTTATLHVLFDSDTSSEALFIDFVAFTEGHPLGNGHPTDTTPTTEAFAWVQLVHNSPSQPTTNVDVYLNDSRFIDDFAYRTATSFIQIPADTSIRLRITADTSTSAATALVDTTLRLTDFSQNIMMIHGVFGSTNYPAAVSIFDQARTASSASNNIDLLFFHGAVEAPDLDVTTGSELLFDDMEYGKFSANYTSVPANVLVLQFTPPNDNSTAFRSYEEDFAFWKNKTALIFATDFLNGRNEFTPWVALSNGGTYPLEFFSMSNGQGDDNNIPDFNLVSVYPNPASDTTILGLNVEEEATITVLLSGLFGEIFLEENLGVLAPGFFETALDLTAVPPGTYFLQVRSLDTVQTVLLVVAR